MRKLLLLTTSWLIATLTFAQQRLFDQKMILKSCNIRINADLFVATTYMEFEFYNPGDVEIEGLEYFTLHEGQVVTGFQLELNGKYRDGSIEEKWKANNAYRSIVGKRIDPAILQMTGTSSYSLNIYPIAPKSSRKVTLTILQKLNHRSHKLQYELPLNFSSVTEKLNVHIDVTNPGALPVTGNGLLAGRYFNSQDTRSFFDMEARYIKLNQPVSFEIPLAPGKPVFCVSGGRDFIMRMDPVTRYYPIKAEKLLIYWDGSGSSASRNIYKEIRFIESYIVSNNIKDIGVIVFHEEAEGVKHFDLGVQKLSGIRKYLLGVKYAGATRFSALDFSGKNGQAVLVFTDGINTIGRSIPKQGALNISCIVSASKYDMKQLHLITGQTGGSVIDLNKTSIDSSLLKLRKAENFLIGVTTDAGSIEIHQALPVALDKPFYLSGRNSGSSVNLVFGNNTQVTSTTTNKIQGLTGCNVDTYKKMRLLERYDSVVRTGSWEDVLMFGITEKIVTARTSYLVLERIEDYIRYKIAPPKELEEECARMNYVYTPVNRKKEIAQSGEEQELKSVADDFNRRIRWWSSVEPLINLNALVVAARTSEKKSGTNNTSNTGINFSNTPNSLQDVVVVSTYQTRNSSRSSSSSIQRIQAQEISTVKAVDFNNVLAGKIAGVQVRSQSAIALGRASEIRLRGENSLGAGRGPIYVIDGAVFPDATDVNIDDILDVSVLHGPAAAALFGSEGQNGAVVIRLKKARVSYWNNNPWTEYKLSSMQEVDYMQAIKKTEKDDIWDEYLFLQKEYPDDPAFQFDLADFFFENGRKEQAMKILMAGIEMCGGERRGLIGAAYLLESWKQFKDAIRIYQDILEYQPDDLSVLRTMALAYLQDGQYQQSIDHYYKIILKESDNNDSRIIKELALSEMNAVIYSYGKQLDLNAIDPHLIKFLPIDLKVSVESNYNYNSDFQLRDPAGRNYLFEDQHYYRQHAPSQKYNRLYYFTGRNEIGIKQAEKGEYRIRVSAYSYSDSPIPKYIRIVSFKNFQKPGQVLEIQTIQMDNQHGVVEIGVIKW